MIFIVYPNIVQITMCCCHDPLSHLAIDALSYTKLMLTRTQIPHDLTLLLEIKVNVSLGRSR